MECTFTPYVVRVYGLLADASDPDYIDLPEREQKVWRLLAHAMQEASNASAA